jgi:hypothetical protein
MANLGSVAGAAVLLVGAHRAYVCIALISFCPPGLLHQFGSRSDNSNSDPLNVLSADIDVLLRRYC